MELVNTLWDALRSTQSKLDSKVDGETVREVFRNELKYDPIKEKFRDACAKGFKGKGKAGGLSGNTYAIIAMWLEKLADLVYDLIVKLDQKDATLVAGSTSGSPSCQRSEVKYLCVM